MQANEMHAGAPRSRRWRQGKKRASLLSSGRCVPAHRSTSAPSISNLKPDTHPYTPSAVALAQSSVQARALAKRTVRKRHSQHFRNMSLETEYTSGHSISGLQDSIDEFETRLQQITTELARQRDEMDRLKAQIAAQRVQINDFNHELDDLGAAMSQLALVLDA